MLATVYSNGSASPRRSRPGQRIGRWLVILCAALAAAGCVSSYPAVAPAMPASASAEAGAPGAPQAGNGSPAVIPADTPVDVAADTAAACPPERVSVKNVRWFQDSEGAWRVVGNIQNAWDKPVSKIVTEVEALDSAGQVIDHGEDISNYPLNLKPGGGAPFSAWIAREFPGVKSFRVEVDECVVAEEMPRGKVTVQSDRLLIDDAGRAVITAELVNKGAAPVLVNGLMAVVLDVSGKPLAAVDATVPTRYLGPGESGPIRATLDLPPGGGKLAASHRLYMDVVITEAKRLPFDPARDIQIASRYVDASGQFHVTAKVTNRGSASLNLHLVAAVYDNPAKERVVDAASLDSTTPLAPGETRQFDFTGWGPANANRGLAADLAGRNAPVEIRADLFASWTNPS